jgi:hypothetical protein
MGLPGPAVADLLFRGRVRLIAWSVKQDTRWCLGRGAARPYHMPYSVVGHGGDGRSTMRRVSTGSVSARLVASQPTPLSGLRGAGHGGPLL